MLGNSNFSCVCCRLLTYFKINFFKKFFQENYQSADLGANCLQWASPDKVAASKERVYPGPTSEYQPEHKILVLIALRSGEGSDEPAHYDICAVAPEPSLQA